MCVNRQSSPRIPIIKHRTLEHDHSGLFYYVMFPSIRGARTGTIGIATSAVGNLALYQLGTVHAKVVAYGISNLNGISIQ